jgi:phage portal protein BeeE
MLNRGNLDVVINIDKTVTAEQFKAVIDGYEAAHMGAHNAGKPLFITGGVDVKTIGQSFEQMSLRATQGANETRIAACAGVPPVIVGLSEGLGAATYSNYAQARRRLSDGTMRPLWGAFAGAMQTLVPPPRVAARLWYDDRDIPWVREDVKDQVEIQQMQAATIRQLVDGGYEPDSVVAAVLSGDYTKLKHTKLFSVQLQPPGTTAKPEQPALPVAPPK